MFHRTLPSVTEFFSRLFKYNELENRSRYKTLTTTNASYYHYKQPDSDYHYTQTTHS